MRTRKPIRILILLVLWLGMAGLTRTATAQEDGPTLEVTPVWEGHARTGVWTELRVVLTNESNDWEGELHVTQEAQPLTYRLELSLPAQSRKQYRLPLLVSTSAFRRLKVTLIQEENAVAEQEIVIHSLPEEGRVCAFAYGGGLIIRESYASCEAVILIQTPDTLPESPMAWDTIDLLLLNGLSTADLTPAQGEALLAWVAAGGHLVVGGGPALPQALSGLPDTLQIATPGALVDETNTLNLEPATGAHPILQGAEGTLAVSAPVGRGQVDIVGWDLSNEDRRSWLEMLWMDDPVPALALPLTGASPTKAQIPSYSLASMPTSRLPGLWQWVVFIPLYVLLAGPATLIIVRRLQRPMLAWALLPLWIVVGIVVLGAWLGGTFADTFPLVHEVALLSSPGPELPARVVQGTAAFAPRARTLTWRTTADPRPLYVGQTPTSGFYREEQIVPTTVTWEPGGEHEMRSQRPLGPLTWGAEGLSEAPEVEISLTLTPSDTLSHFQGNLWSEVPLNNVSLLLDGGAYRLHIANDVPADTEFAIDEPLTDLEDLNTSYVQLCPMLENTPSPYGLYGTPRPRQPAIGDQGCYLVATTDGVPFPSQGFGGTQAGETCLLIHVGCPNSTSGTTVIPLTPWMDSHTGGWIDGDVVHVAQPATTLSYLLPQSLRPTTIDRITLQMDATPSTAPASIPDASSLRDALSLELWDWEQDIWVRQPLPISDTPLILRSGLVARYLDPEAGLRARLTPTPDLSMISVRLRVMVQGTHD